MKTVLAPCFRPLSFRKGVGVTAFAALVVGLGSPGLQAQTLASALPAESANSMIGRVAASSAADGPVAVSRLTVERNRLLESERMRLGNGGADLFGRPLTETSAVTYRWWLGRGASNFGLGVGATGYLVPSSEGMNGAQAVTYTSSMLTLGYRYQVNNRSALFADASGTPRHFSADAVDRFSTKVGVEWKASSRKFGLDGASRSLALQLDSGYKMAVKVRRNGFGVYVRGQF